MTDTESAGEEEREWADAEEEAEPGKKEKKEEKDEDDEDDVKY